MSVKKSTLTVAEWDDIFLLVRLQEELARLILDRISRKVFHKRPFDRLVALSNGSIRYDLEGEAMIPPHDIHLSRVIDRNTVDEIGKLYYTNNKGKWYVTLNENDPKLEEAIKNMVENKLIGNK